MAEPPVELGAVKATLACALPEVTFPMVGAPGAARGITEAPAEATPVPAELVAVTVQEYVLPLVRPVTTIGLAVPVPVMAAEVPVTQDAV